MKKIVSLASILSLLLLAGCAPKVGSDEWCKDLEDKPKGDWTANEAKDYTKYCVFGADNEE